MGYAEDDLLPLSGLQHLRYCERQWALIHLENQWVENRFTAEGRVLHERTHTDEVELRGDVRIVRGLRLRSLSLGLVGQADVVEFHRVVSEDAAVVLDGAPAAAAPLPGVAGLWRPFPVEYKRGKPKPDESDEIQLCAQALCVEEMLQVAVPAGALFYGRIRRRLEVPFDRALRAVTCALAERMHALFSAGETPRVAYGPKCDACSLLAVCMPKTTGNRGRVERYIARTLNSSERTSGDE